MWVDMMSRNPPPLTQVFLRPALICAGLLLALIALHYDAMKSMVQIWWNAKTFNHCLLIPFISGWLIHQNRSQWMQHAPQSSWTGFALLSAASFLIVVASLTKVNAALHFALVTAVIALLWMVFGNAFARLNRFALLYLYFAVPFGEFLVPALQDVTAEMAVAMLRAIDIPTFTDGRLIEIPTGSFLVAEACSGISYLIAALALGTLFAHLYYQSIWRKAAFIGLSIVVPIIANGIRAFMIIYIAYKTNNEYAVGIDHLIYGWIFFGVVILLMFFIGQMFAEPVSKSETSEQVLMPLTRHSLYPMAGLGFAVLVVSSLLAERESQTPTLQPDLQAFAAPMQEIEQDLLGVRFRGAAWQRQWRDGNWQFVLGYFPQEQAGSELISSAHQLYDDSYWDLIGNPIVQLNQQAVTSYRLRNHHQRVIGMVNLPLFADGQLRKGWQVKWHQLQAQLLERASPAYQLVIIYPPEQEARLNEPALQQRLQQLVATLELTP